VKTTVEIPDAVMRKAKLYAADQGIPLREVFTRGVEAVVGDKKRSAPFRLKTITTKGKGLVVPGDWDSIRDLSYKGRGG